MFKKWLLFLITLTTFFSLSQINYSYAGDYDSRVKSSSPTNSINNDRLENLKLDVFIEPRNANKGAGGIAEFIIKIAKDIKNVFYAIATIYFLVITVRLLFSSNSEESFESYKKGLVWITLGIVVMQLSYAFVLSVYDKNASGLAASLITTVIIPLIRLLETLASVFFLLIAVYSFIRLLSSNGNKENIKKGIDSIIYATVGIFLVMFSTRIIMAIYGKYSFTSSGSNIVKESSFSDFITMFIKFINWMNGFVAIITLIMIMYAGVNIIFSAGDEEKMKKGRTTIVYAFIGILILTISYLILTFFISPDGTQVLSIP